MNSIPSAPNTSRYTEAVNCTCISERLVEMLIFKSETRIRQSLEEELENFVLMQKKRDKQYTELKNDFDTLLRLVKNMELKTSRMDDECKK